MARRKLFFYAVSLSGGIVAGFIMFEREELFFSLLFFCILIFVLKEAIECEKNVKKNMFVCFVVGFVIFGVSYYNGLPDITEDTYVSVTGVVKNIEKNEYGYKLVFATEIESDKTKVLINYYGELEISSENQNDDLDDDNADSLECMYSYIGREISVSGTLYPEEGARNPGCFDYRIYLLSKGIKYRLKADSIELIDSASDAGLYFKIKNYLLLERYQFEELFSDDEDVYAFLKGAVWGDSSEIDDDTYNEFSSNATGHILAVSGLHVGFLYTLLRTITGKRRMLSVTAAVFVALFLYGELTMWSPATLRAVIILMISQVSFWIKRPFDLLSALSAAAMVILIFNPYQLFNSGFQMSFLAMLGISFITPLTSFYFGNYFGMLSAVQLAMVPVTMYSYNKFNLLAIFINIPVVALASLMIPFCLLLFLTGILPFTAPQIFIDVIKGMAGLVLEMNHFLYMDGLFSNDVISLNIGLIAAVYLFIFYLSSETFKIKILRNEKSGIKRSIAAILAVSVVLFISFRNDFVNDDIVFIDVGQGDGIHIRTESGNYLIDGGGQVSYSVGSNILKPYLLKNGVSKIDLALLTHMHTDHALGLEELCSIYTVEKVALSDMYSETILPFSEVEMLSAGDKVIIGKNAYIKVLWPLEGEAVEVDDENEANMVMMVVIDDYRIMITGDLLEEDEVAMLEYYSGTSELECDVLKVAHHGSKYSSSEAFLDAADPDIAVIQVGENNIYGHPTQEVLDRLNERGIEVYRNDTMGAIGFELTSRGIKVDVMID